ncbi:hypothetical protein KQH62_04790 [bacterium]|nr:hypothetical protein [bacterium]
MQDGQVRPKQAEHRLVLEASARPISAGRFEVLAITAGEGNGWHFPAAALKASLPLWEGVYCFIDHDRGARSVRDIGGVLQDATWDESSQGIRATLAAFGPGGPVLTALGEQLLSGEGHPAGKIGFSADVLFAGKNRIVEKVLKVFSVDLVYDPARGGAFLRALNQSDEQNGGLRMAEQVKDQGTGTVPTNTPGEDVATMALETRAVRQQMCRYLLDSALDAAKLPQPAAARVRKQFAGQVFDPAELDQAIEDARGLVSELTGAAVVNGPGRITGMVTSEERLQTAVDDLFGVPRSKPEKNLSVARLSGIRELYLGLTGDTEMHGGYFPTRAQLATTADFTGLVKNALNILVVNTWEALGRAGYNWWQQVSVVEHFNTLNDITGTLVGTVGDLPTVAEGDPYTELVVGDSPETASFVKYGGYIPLTLELIDRDETRKLRAYARELASAGLRKISRLVSEIFTANAGVGPTMADGGTLFNPGAVTTATGHGNLRTEDLSADEWDAVCAAVYDQPMLVKHAATHYGTGPKMAVNPKFLLIPRALQKTAFQILQGEFVREQDYVYDNVLKGAGAPLVVPEWADPSSWAAACDPVIAPAIYVGERFGVLPEIYVAGDELSPAVFMNDEHRLKVRHYLAVWVNDFRPLHKNNIAA